MDGSTLLLIHNAGYIIDSVLLAALMVLLFVKARSSLAGRLLIYCFFFVLVFTVSHVIGVNVGNPDLSHSVLMANLANLFLSVFLAHFFFVLTAREKQEKWPLIVMYAISFALLVFYLLFPDQFLLPSSPKLYFPDYYVAGPLDWLARLWANVIVPVYFVGRTMLEYPRYDAALKNRIKYILAATAIGYIFGAFAIPLVFIAYPTIFGVVIDPVWSVLFVPFFSVPFVYAVVRYELIDIKIVAKQALLYFVLVEAIGVVISLLIFFDDYIRTTFPSLPIWVLPIIFSVIFVSVGAAVWRRLSETDVLKYEFITVVTHKFRTPLTRIKWAAEDVAAAIPQEKKESLDTILESERQLLALTDILVHLSDADASAFDYHPQAVGVPAIFADLGVQYSVRADRKGVALSFDAPAGLSVLIDPEKSSFIFQILLDNALSYTPAGGSIKVRAYRDADLAHVVIEVADTGIGMSRETASRVFKRFYRGENARHADTEGMGIGLFMAKSIAEKQGGKISVSSEGEGKGSAFSVRFPFALAKR